MIGEPKDNSEYNLRRDQWLIDSDLNNRDQMLNTVVAIMKVLGILSGAAILALIDLSKKHEIAESKAEIAAYLYLLSLSLSIFIGIFTYFNLKAITDASGLNINKPILIADENDRARWHELDRASQQKEPKINFTWWAGFISTIASLLIFFLTTFWVIASVFC